MIRKILFVIMTLAMVLTAQVSRGQSDMEEAVQTLNRECPIPMGVVGSIVSFKIDDVNLTFVFELNEEIVSIAGLKQNEEQLGINAAKALNASNKSTSLLDMLLDGGYGIKMVFIGQQSKDTAILVSDIKTLRSVADAPKSTPNELLKTAVENAKLQLPEQEDEITLFTDIYIDGDYIVYVYELDINELLFDYITDDAAKELITESFAELSKDFIFKRFLKMVVDGKKHIKAIYNCKGSDKKLEIVVTNDELNKMLNDDK